MIIALTAVFVALAALAALIWSLFGQIDVLTDRLMVLEAAERGRTAAAKAAQVPKPQQPPGFRDHAGDPATPHTFTPARKRRPTG